MTTDRGYTGHEHLDEMGIIHMNGRIYDPLIGRFMSADPYIQAPDMLQSYNRYAYVMNNPLNLTDPSGYWSFRSFFRGLFRIVAPVIALLPPQLASPLINIVSLACGPWAPVCAGAGQAALAYYHGASGSEAFRIDVRAGATAFLFQQAGLHTTAGTPESYLAHAGAGCVSAVANGGNCGQGALSSVAGKFASNAGSKWGDSFGADAARFAAAVTAGGISSVIAGGKFANGAETAAYGYLFNQVASRIAGASAGRCLLFCSSNALQNTGDPDLDMARQATGTSTSTSDTVKGIYGPYHRFDGAPVVALIAGSGEVWGTNPRFSMLSDIPAIKAHAGPLPPGTIGTEFYTDVPPTNGHPTMPRWTLSPGVTPAPLPGFIRMPVRVTNYVLTIE